jgi:hypothetical protein
MKVTDMPQRHPDAVYQIVAEGTVLIKLSTQEVYDLNDTGTRFWELLDGRRTVADCAQSIAAEYDVAVEEVETDLLELALELHREGLIIV